MHNSTGIKDEENYLKAEEYYNSLSTEEKIKLSNVVSYICGQNHQLNEKEIVDVFKKLDVNNSGSISVNDLQSFLSVLGPQVNNYYINEIMKEYTQNEEGEISKDVFVEKMKESIKGKYKKEDITELKEVFQLFDANHDNKISYEDIMSVMSVLGETAFTEKMCKDLIRHLKNKKDEVSDNDSRSLDSSCDNTLFITYDEFVEIVKDEPEN